MTVSVTVRMGRLYQVLIWASLVQPQLLNTVANLGGTWPKVRDTGRALLYLSADKVCLPQPVVLKGIDYFSVSSCRIKEETGEVVALRGDETTRYC
jgi:hypothetical protein